MRRLAVLLALSLSLAACGESPGNWSYGALVDVKALREATGTRDLSHQVPAGRPALELRLRAELERGSLRVKLLDPDGAVGWQQSLTAPADGTWEESLPARPGTWTARVSFDGASGRYDLRLVAR